MIPTKTSTNPVILFDGVCNLCNRSVKFVIKHDKGRTFRFASLQSAFGESVLKQFGLSQTDLNSFILYEDGKIFTRSSAAMNVVKRLNGAIRILYAFIIVPKFIRDAVYNYIAKNRYKWFGKTDECWVPTKETADLFIN